MLVADFSVGRADWHRGAVLYVARGGSWQDQEAKESVWNADVCKGWAEWPAIWTATWDGGPARQHPQSHAGTEVAGDNHWCIYPPSVPGKSWFLCFLPCSFSCVIVLFPHRIFTVILLCCTMCIFSLLVPATQFATLKTSVLIPYEMLSLSCLLLTHPQHHNSTSFLETYYEYHPIGGHPRFVCLNSI